MFNLAFYFSSEVRRAIQRPHKDTFAYFLNHPNDFPSFPIIPFLCLDVRFRNFRIGGDCPHSAAVWEQCLRAAEIFSQNATIFSGSAQSQLGVRNLQIFFREMMIKINCETNKSVKANLHCTNRSQPMRTISRLKSHFSDMPRIDKRQTNFAKTSGNQQQQTQVIQQNPKKCRLPSVEEKDDLANFIGSYLYCSKKYGGSTMIHNDIQVSLN